mmetsp:Transcript_21623/g.56417  ORF Transcript_21623/g.56417 Transcript_21623/m.56417 type:complete len:90 (-) Transcript_21623:791-1060(-)
MRPQKAKQLPISCNTKLFAIKADLHTTALLQRPDEDSAGVFQFKVFESSQESMSFLDDNADMDVDGMCAVSEELQEVIDKIVEIVDDAL